MHVINTQNPWVNVMCLPKDDSGIQSSSEGWELTMLCSEPHGLHLLKQLWHSLLAVGILVYEAYWEGMGAKRTGCDATNCIAECRSRRQGLLDAVPFLGFFLLALFSIQARSEEHFLCIATFTFGWITCHRARMKLSFTVEERKPNWWWHTYLYGPCVNYPGLQMNRYVLQLYVCML